jgi:hypothetical protein
MANVVAPRGYQLRLPLPNDSKCPRRCPGIKLTPDSGVTCVEVVKNYQPPNIFSRSNIDPPSNPSFTPPPN